MMFFNLWLNRARPSGRQFIDFLLSGEGGRHSQRHSINGVPPAGLLLAGASIGHLHLKLEFEGKLPRTRRRRRGRLASVHLLLACNGSLTGA